MFGVMQHKFAKSFNNYTLTAQVLINDLRLTATAQMAVASPFLLVATSLYAPQSAGTTLSIYSLTEPSGKAVSLT
jgi:hypothetical protein